LVGVAAESMHGVVVVHLKMHPKKSSASLALCRRLETALSK
jgi:hypothetical protein